MFLLGRLSREKHGAIKADSVQDGATKIIEFLSNADGKALGRSVLHRQRHMIKAAEHCVESDYAAFIPGKRCRLVITSSGRRHFEALDQETKAVA